VVVVVAVVVVVIVVAQPPGSSATHLRMGPYRMNSITITTTTTIIPSSPDAEIVYALLGFEAEGET
jgi:hypothetical protein